ncbi:cobalamin-dependent protein [soil metagenome]
MPMFDRLHTEPVYNTRAVVQRTGVPADTIRAWERRYGAPAPCRTTGNQRLYSERDLALICWLRDQTRAGLTISQAVALHNSICNDKAPATSDTYVAMTPVVDREPIVEESQPTLFFDRVASPAHTEQSPTFRSRVPLARMCGEIADALTRFDDQRAERVIEELMVFTAVEEICCHILEPVLSEISRQREQGSLTAGAENFATAFILRKINVLFNISRPHTGRGPIVAAGVQGDHREIGLLVTSLFLSRYGYHVIYMGPNLPPGDLIQAARMLRSPFVLLAANTESDIDTLNYTVTELVGRFEREFGQANPPVVGYVGTVFAARPELRRRVDAEFLGNDAFSSVASVDRLLSQERTI